VKRRILFVDDEPAFLEGLRRGLRGQRDAWEMHFVQSADEALQAVEGVDFDVVVTDVNMPGRDGLELLVALRESDRTRAIPVIILTGRGERDIKRRALDLGATDLLNKPVEREDLVARLRSVLKLKAYQDELKAQNEILDRKVRERTTELEESRLAIIWRLAKASEYRDEETGNHVRRVGWYCRALAEALGMPSDFVEMVFLTSPLHDIGKIGIPDRILRKRGGLTPAEWRVMQRHCEIGAAILLHEGKRGKAVFSEETGRAVAPPRATGGLPASVGDRRASGTRRSASVSDWGEEAALSLIPNPFLEMAATIARAHHERFDGGGYPAGLAGEAIPVEARIVALADTYDALCAERPYKPAFPEAKALRIIGEEVGSHFDPRVYAAFLASVDTLRSIRVELSDEREPLHVGGPVS